MMLFTQYRAKIVRILVFKIQNLSSSLQIMAILRNKSLEYGVQ